MNVVGAMGLGNEKHIKHETKRNETKIGFHFAMRRKRTWNNSHFDQRDKAYASRYEIAYALDLDEKKKKPTNSKIQSVY